MIDTHAHIYLPEFSEDRAGMIKRAAEAGVRKIFLPNIDADSITDMHALSNAFPEICFPMMGLHPCSVGDDYVAVLSTMNKLIESAEYTYYGIGECGLDYYWDKSKIAEQKAAFKEQIQWAKKYQLPLIIHSRDATDDCIEMVEAEKGKDLRGIFHCFSGTPEQLERVIATGFFVGIGGVVTFKNGGLDKVLRPEHLPYIVLETDSPYLAPVPFRGKRNEPSYLSYIVERLAQVLSVSEAEVRAISTQNAEHLFGF